MEPFVSVEKHNGKAVVKVRIGDKHRRYPLTKAGCLEAGRDLFKAGAESWMNSSSVDFPEECKPGFKWDVRELMGQGFQEEIDKKNAPKHSMYKKLMAFAEPPLPSSMSRTKNPFRESLSEDEETAFDELITHIAELTKGK